MSPTPLSSHGAVMDYLLALDLYELFPAIKGDLSLDDSRALEFFDLAMAYAEGDLSATDMPELLAGAFELDEPAAKSLATRFIGQVLWPLREYDPSLVQAFEALGGQADSATKITLEHPRIGSKEAATAALKEAGLEPTDFTVQRLALLLVQYQKGEKTPEILANFFGRSLNIGGLALAKADIDRLLAAIEVQKAAATIVSDAEFATVRAKYDQEHAPIGLVEPAPAAAPRKVVAMTLKPATPEALPANTAEKTRDATALATAYTQAYEKALEVMLGAMPEIVGAHKEAEQKLLDILGKGIRGVRDIYQTRDALKSQLKLSDVELQGVMSALAKGFETYAEGGGHGQEAEVPEGVADILEEVEAAAFDRRYAALTGKAPLEKGGAILPAARVSAARTPEEEVATNFARVPEAVMRQAEEALRPAPAKVELTVGSVSPEAQHALTDVVPTGRLHSPIDQLASLNTTEFRRLNSSPDEAAAIVERLINDLQATDIEERIKGVRAWKMSPINALYAEITGEALTAGKSVADIAAARRARGAASLSPAEMKALNTLNSKLRF